MMRKRVWGLLIALAMIWPSAAMAKNEGLNGLESVRTFLAQLTDDGKACGLDEDALKEAIEKPIKEGGIELEPGAQVFFFVNVTTIHLTDPAYCMSSVGIDVYTRQYIDIVVTGQTAPVTLTLWEAGIVFGGPASDHANEVVQVLRQRATEFSLDWLSAQQQQAQ